MSLTLTYEPLLSRVRITATGLSDVAPVRVERSTDEVRWSTVRGGGELTPSGGAVRLDDYEFTADVVNHYRVMGAVVGFDTFNRALNANPFFETDVANWTVSGGASLAWSTSAAWEGAGSALIGPDGVSTSVVFTSERVPVTAGQVYRPSAMVRCAVARSVNIQVQWFDSGGTEVLPLSAAATSLSASTWTLLDTTFTAPVGATQAAMRVSMSSTPPTSHLLRVDAATLYPAAGWGVSESGQSWSHYGVLTAFAVAGGLGRHIHTAADSGRMTVVDTGYNDHRVRVIAVAPEFASGGTLGHYATGRFADDLNNYQCRLAYLTDQRLTCSVRRRLAGTTTTLQSVVIPGLTHVPGRRYVVELDVSGSQLRGRAWEEGSEPPDWLAEATDTSIPVGTKAGVWSSTEPTIANPLPFTYSFDDFVATSQLAVAASAQVTPSIGGVWLKSLARPFLNRQVTVRDFSEVTRRSRAGVFDVVGRSMPVAVTDARGSRQWALDLSTYSEQDRSALDLLLASGDILLVQVPPSAGRLSATPGGYVVVGDTRETAPPTSDLAMRVFSLPCVEVAPPGPDVVGATSNWQTVLSSYASWADLLADHTDWASVSELVGDPEDVIVT